MREASARSRESCTTHHAELRQLQVQLLVGVFCDPKRLQGLDELVPRDRVVSILVEHIKELNDPNLFPKEIDVEPFHARNRSATG